MKKFSLKQLLCLGVVVANLAAVPALADTTSPTFNWRNPGNWRGAYVGGFAGGAWTDFDNNAGDDTSLLYGGDLGYNWQMDHIVFGLEGDFSKYNNHVGGGGVKFTQDWMATGRGRLGYSLDRLLPYVTGGVAFTDTTSKVAGVGTSEDTRVGFTAGGGVETLLSNNMTGRLEYLYVDVPNRNTSVGTTSVNGGSSNNIVRVGLNFKF